MTDHTDNKLSTLYKSISNEKPSIAADDAILKLATDAAQTQSQASWIKKWSAPMSIAAVVVLSVSIVSVIKHESAQAPEIVSMLADHDHSPIRQKLAKKKQSSSQSLSLQRSPTQNPNLPDMELQESENLASTFAMEPPQAELEISSAAQISQTKQAKAPALTPESSIAATSTERRDNRLNTTSRKRESQTPIPVILQKRSIVNAPSQISSFASGFASPNSSAVQIQSQEKRMTPSRLAANKAKSRAKDMFSNERQSMNNAELCAQTSQAKCLKSTLCILQIHISENKISKNIRADNNVSELRCVAANNQCEKNFMQNNSNSKQCQRNSNCTFRAGNCLCDNNEECDCGKTGPAMCVLNH